MLKNVKGPIKNGQSKHIVNIGQTRHRTKTNNQMKNQNETQQTNKQKLKAKHNTENTIIFNLMWNHKRLENTKKQKTRTKTKNKNKNKTRTKNKQN